MLYVYLLQYLYLTCTAYHDYFFYFTIKGADEIYKSKWFAYEAMSFLKDRDDPRSTVSSEDVSFSIFTTTFINMRD